MSEKIVTVLGDSRAFDTYYYNPYYREFYGYDRTFPFLLRRRLLLATGGEVDVVHVPDHFRGGTVENNVLRIAMTDPEVVVLCNGLWETLVSKRHFVEYAMKELEGHETHSGETLDLRYNSAILARLFLENRLSNSPLRFRERERRIISYFRRRRRQLIYMNLTVPDRSHLNRVHYAGNYRCIPEWDVCLRGLNETMQPVVESYGARLLDTDALMRHAGGASRSLIDQWHYSVSFHQMIAEHLGTMVHEILNERTLPKDHASRGYLVPKKMEEGRLAVYGTGEEAGKWIREHPRIRVEAVIEQEPKVVEFYSIPVIPERELKTIQSPILLLLMPEGKREELEVRLLGTLGMDKVILYPEELEEVQNPLPARNHAEG